MASEDTETFKCVLAGDGYIGKSTFIKKLTKFPKTDDPKVLPKKYVYPLAFNTNAGNIQFDVYDTAGQEIFGGLRDCFFSNAECAIIMFDITSPTSYKNVRYWHRKILSLCGKIPMVLCGNKADIKFRKVKTEQIYADWGRTLNYFEVSGKSRTKVFEPFLFLSEHLLGSGEIVDFTRVGSEVSMDLSHLSKLNDEAKDRNSKQH
ncbi:unnamed protein product [Diamesa serratosioi]